MKIRLFALVMCFAVTAPANAGVTHSDVLEDARSVVVEVQDGVADGLLPNPNSLQTKAELNFRSTSILVVSECTASFRHRHELRPSAKTKSSPNSPTKCAKPANNDGGPS